FRLRRNAPDLDRIEVIFAEPKSGARCIAGRGRDRQAEVRRRLQAPEAVELDRDAAVVRRRGAGREGAVAEESEQGGEEKCSKNDPAGTVDDPGPALELHVFGDLKVW